MGPVLIIVVALILLVVALVFVFRPYEYGAQAPRTLSLGVGDEPDPPDNTRWQSVRIRPGLGSCERAKALSDRIFLSREAPALPLSDCFESNCTCHYLFYGDRRSGLDRRIELQRLAGLIPGIGRDRRHNPGRRLGDLVPT